MARGDAQDGRGGGEGDGPGRGRSVREQVHRRPSYSASRLSWLSSRAALPLHYRRPRASLNCETSLLNGTRSARAVVRTDLPRAPLAPLEADAGQLAPRSLSLLLPPPRCPLAARPSLENSQTRPRARSSPSSLAPLQLAAPSSAAPLHLARPTRPTRPLDPAHPSARSARRRTTATTTRTCSACYRARRAGRQEETRSTRRRRRSSLECATYARSGRSCARGRSTSSSRRARRRTARRRRRRPARRRRRHRPGSSAGRRKTRRHQLEPGTSLSSSRILSKPASDGVLARRSCVAPPSEVDEPLAPASAATAPAYQPAELKALMRAEP